ncbi:hypothetical protein HY768_11140 [candidate division TA06 bacterium]|uniref:Outer membrane protein beta-barrel domain-containing protein n=1 Tax=candidate division TA06 bacterium TaxID=2250710 RepID=A0A933ID17_UNCT6|nr:hypothetical protein [candidate division TA06 bacterium]
MLKALKTTLFLSIFAVLAFVPGQVQAQEAKYNYTDDEGYGFNSGNRILLGYAANIPNQYLGFTLGFSRPRTWGLFIDYKMNTASLDIASYLYDYTVEYVATVYTSDTLKDTRGSWITVNGGMTRPLNDNFCAYLGLGVSFYRVYRQYYEPYKNMGDNGYYWINDDQSSTANFNANAGVYYKLGRYFYLHLGGDIRPLGLTAGFGLAP